ncbi:MAG: hypothetical protein ACE5IO_00855 [Thermoplasmata archaeon]
MIPTKGMNVKTGRVARASRTPMLVVDKKVKKEVVYTGRGGKEAKEGNQ